MSEIDLRVVVSHANSAVPSRQPGRWTVQGRTGRGTGIVVVEPDIDEQIVHVVTAYPKT